jgi:hypothetical protein
LAPFRRGTAATLARFVRSTAAALARFARGTAAALARTLRSTAIPARARAIPRLAGCPLWPTPPNTPSAAPPNGRAQTPWPVPPEILPPPSRTQTPWPVPPAQQAPPPGYPHRQPNEAAAQRAFLLVGLVLLSLIVAVSLIAGLRG